MINPSKLFAITAIGLCLGVNMLQGSNTDTNDLNQHSKTTRTINPRSTVALMRTMAVFLASTGTEAFKTPPPHTPKQNPNFTGHISRHSELFSEQNLNEQIDAPHKIDPFVLANQRFATIGTSYEEYVSEL